jgi:hypothetical protein
MRERQSLSGDWTPPPESVAQKGVSHAGFLSQLEMVWKGSYEYSRKLE